MFAPRVPVFDANAALGRRHDERILHDRPQDLLRVMSEAGISRCLVYNPYCIRWGTREGNAFLLEGIRNHQRLVPQFVACLATDDPGLFREEVRAAGVRSLRVFPRSHRYPLVSWVADPWLEWMAREGVALWVNLGLRPEVDVRDLYETARRHPDVPTVLAACHYSDYASVWPLLKALDHLYFDLSRFDLANGVERLIQHVGVNRLLFGSDFPEVDPEPYLFYLHHCGLTPDELRAICHDNLVRLLGEG